MSIYREEIFGPVLSCVRVADLGEAIELVNAHEYGNGVSCYTRDGDAAREFARHVQVGMVGINVPIPVPMAWHGFGGWKRSLFGDLHAYGEEGVRFYTRQKAIMQRWPADDRQGRRLRDADGTLKRRAGPRRTRARPASAAPSCIRAGSPHVFGVGAFRRSSPPRPAGDRPIMHATPHPNAVTAQLQTLAALAQLLERLDRSAERVDAGQYRGVALRLAELLAQAAPGPLLDRLLGAFPSAAEVYENVRYEHAGLCRTPLEMALNTELQARAAIDRAASSQGAR